MSFWSGETLSQRLPGLIEPYDAKKIDCAAYKLRIGPDVYVTQTSQDRDPKAKTKVQLDEGQGFTIPPGQFGFLVTEEIVKVPSDAMAFISVRSKLKFRGLVNISGFHVDPGYEGRLIFSVFNAGPTPVHLQRGDDCFLIWYAQLDRTSEMIKSAPGFTQISTDLINPIAGTVLSLEDLSERIRMIERDHIRIRVIAAVATTLIVLGITVLIGPWIRDRWFAVRSAAPQAPIESQARQSNPAPSPTAPDTRAPADPNTQLPGALAPPPAQGKQSP